jgi:purine nucleoside permease
MEIPNPIVHTVSRQLNTTPSYISMETNAVIDPKVQSLDSAMEQKYAVD